MQKNIVKVQYSLGLGGVKATVVFARIASVSGLGVVALYDETFAGMDGRLSGW